MCSQRKQAAAAGSHMQAPECMVRRSDGGRGQWRERKAHREGEANRNGEHRRKIGWALAATQGHRWACTLGALATRGVPRATCAACNKYSAACNKYNSTQTRSCKRAAGGGSSAAGHRCCCLLDRPLGEPGPSGTVLRPGSATLAARPTCTHTRNTPDLAAAEQRHGAGAAALAAAQAALRPGA